MNVTAEREELWRVGDLARRTGVSVRTLHYYDEIGLLSPSRHSEGKHRLYESDDVVRLQQIRSLQQMGLSLDEVRECLDGEDFSPRAVIAIHLERLRRQIRSQQILCERLDAIAHRLDAAELVSAGEFIQLVETMTMVEKYYTPEQLEELRQRREVVGDERIRAAEGEWETLMAGVRTEMERGTDPSEPHVQELARKWMSLVQEFTGGNREIESSVKQMWQEETEIHGINTAEMRKMSEYIQKAFGASKGGE